MADAARQNMQTKSNGHYPYAEQMCAAPHLSIASTAPGGPSTPRPNQNYGWMITAIIWVVGGIFTAGTLYSIITSLKEDFAAQKAQVERLSETVTRIDERQTFYTQVLQEIRNDVKGMRRENR